MSPNASVCVHGTMPKLSGESLKTRGGRYRFLYKDRSCKLFTVPAGVLFHLGLAG